jgi:hypothetical protein
MEIEQESTDEGKIITFSESGKNFFAVVQRYENGDTTLEYCVGGHVQGPVKIIQKENKYNGAGLSFLENIISYCKNIIYEK